MGTAKDVRPRDDAERRGLLDRAARHWTIMNRSLRVAAHDVRNRTGEVLERLNRTVSKAARYSEAPWPRETLKANEMRETPAG